MSLENSLGSQGPDRRKRRDTVRVAGSLGPWDLVSELGRGSFGIVYEARNAQTGVRAAVKVMKGAGPVDPLDVRRFQREIALLARLDHANVVRTLDSGVTGGVPWVALELVEGRPLQEVGLDLPQFVDVLAKIARAVGAAHRAQVIHRDLKPGNILIDEKTGAPKVLDFGLAFDARLDASRLSRTGEIAGTPAYFAPEVLRGGHGPDDPRRDVYALG
ncbi:MAG: serine/threonine-protein kinase, partial [Planctomycetota bacterium]